MLPEKSACVDQQVELHRSHVLMTTLSHNQYFNPHSPIQLA